MTSKSKQALYFIALVPPEPICSVVNDLKRSISEKYHSNAALRSPPHITLYMPFRWKEHKEQELFSALSKIHLLSSIEIIHHGFGSFPPRVIYVNVKPSDELNALQKTVDEKMRHHLKVVKENYRGQGYQPHMTIAFRDLKPAQFKIAWNEYEQKEIKLNWEASSFFLLKHSGLEWGLCKEFSFS